MTQDIDRTAQRATAWAETMAASPLIRELVDVAQAALEEGADEQTVRMRVREQAEAMDLTSWRFLLPGLNRKVLRYPFPRFLLKAAEYYAEGTRHKSIKDAIESFTSRVGWDEWLVNNVIGLAKTGEPVPLLGSLFGGVHVQPVTIGGESTPVVMLVAGPASDFEALADEFLATCSQVYPAREHWERSKTEMRDGRWTRAFLEGRSDAEIAWSELTLLHPGEIVWCNPKYDDEHRRKIAQVKQARKRFTDKVTKILDCPSLDSETGS